MTVDDWLDCNRVVARLENAGMSPECAEQAAPCFVKAAGYLRPHVRGRSVVACWAPGRIEVLGKHTDYCGGDSILAAAERGFCMLATPRDDGVVAIVNPQQPVRSVVLEKSTPPTLGHWSNYPHTVVRRLAKNFPQASRGATIAFASNLPKASGMSSSSAFVVGTFLLLSQINNLEHDETYRGSIHSKEDLAGYLSSVENGMSFGPLTGDKGVGTFGGSEDHTAVLCGQSNRLVQYGFCPVRFRRSIGLDDNYVFVVASSGVISEKTGAALEKYNRISALVRTIVRTWQMATGRDDQSLAAILESTRDGGTQLRNTLLKNTDASAVADFVERLDHFGTESRLIDSVPKTINASTMGKFGESAYESHSMAHSHLKNQTAETNRLVAIAEELGAPAASAFGAGFGGSVWAIVDCPSAAQFSKEWAARYEREFPATAARAEFFATRPGKPAITDFET